MSAPQITYFVLLGILIVTSCILVTLLILRARAFTKKRRLENIVADFRVGSRSRRK